MRVTRCETTPDPNLLHQEHVVPLDLGQFQTCVHQQALSVAPLASGCVKLILHRQVSGMHATAAGVHAHESSPMTYSSQAEHRQLGLSMPETHLDEAQDNAVTGQTAG